eukprot:Awhi_evm1s2717
MYVDSGTAQCFYRLQNVICDSEPLEPESPPVVRPAIVRHQSLAGPECTLCVGLIEYYSIGPCNHIGVCHRCSLRLRVISESIQCPICRQDCETVVFTKDAEYKFSAVDTQSRNFIKSCGVY